MNIAPLILLITLEVASCNIQPSSSLNQLLFGGGYKIYDLTWPFDNNTIYWIGTREFEFTKIERSFENGIWIAENEFCAGEHGGTHVDAPYHFYVNGAFVGDLPIANFITPLLIVDVEWLVNGNPNFVLQVNQVDNTLANCLNPNWNYTVVFKFGWSKYYSDPERYLGGDGSEENPLNFPGISPEVATWIVTKHPNIVGVGFDTPSADPAPNEELMVHRTLTRAGIYLMENIKLLEKLPATTCTAAMLPMKIAKGSGAPMRIAAICPV